MANIYAYRLNKNYEVIFSQFLVVSKCFQKNVKNYFKSMLCSLANLYVDSIYTFNLIQTFNYLRLSIGMIS